MTELLVSLEWIMLEEKPNLSKELEQEQLESKSHIDLNAGEHMNLPMPKTEWNTESSLTVKLLFMSYRRSSTSPVIYQE